MRPHCVVGTINKHRIRPRSMGLGSGKSPTCSSKSSVDCCISSRDSDSGEERPPGSQCSVLPTSPRPVSPMAHCPHRAPRDLFIQSDSSWWSPERDAGAWAAPGPEWPLSSWRRDPGVRPVGRRLLLLPSSRPSVPEGAHRGLRVLLVFFDGYLRPQRTNGGICLNSHGPSGLLLSPPTPLLRAPRPLSAATPLLARVPGKRAHAG